MPSNYKRIFKQQRWKAVDMLKAIDAIKYKNVSYSEIAKCFKEQR